MSGNVINIDFRIVKPHSCEADIVRCSPRFWCAPDARVHTEDVGVCGGAVLDIGDGNRRNRDRIAYGLAGYSNVASNTLDLVCKLPLPEQIDVYVSTRMAQLGARSLAIANSHTLRVATLPLHHRDPFDRMLIAQAQAEDMILVSADLKFNQYEVSLLWAASS